MKRHQGPADKTVHTREDGPTVRLCGDSEVAGKRNNGQCYLGQKFRGTIGQIQKNIVLMAEMENRKFHLED